MVSILFFMVRIKAESPVNVLRVKAETLLNVFKNKSKTLNIFGKKGKH